MSDPQLLTCPYCGEPVDVAIDEGGGPQQSYVEDCPVCCRPWQVDVTYDEDDGWNAALRTADE
jgi:hypothetical protein